MTRFPAQVSRVNIGDADNNVAGGDNEAAAGIAGFSPCQCSGSKLLRNIKAIIFDFDGTLFDNALFPFNLISAYPLDCRRIWAERLVRKHFTGCDLSSTEEYYKAFFTAFGKACCRSPQRLRDWYFNRYIPRMVRVLQKHYVPRPGVTELFRIFAAAAGGASGIKAVQTENFPPPFMPGIAVYSDYPCLKDRMEALGIYTGPDVLLYSPDSFGAQKPAVRPFLCIAKDLGAAPEEVLVVGDREETDGLGAFNAGMRFFCLETGRKRHFRLDPNRRPVKEEPHGPSLLMYAGAWDDLYKLLIEKLN